MSVKHNQQIVLKKNKKKPNIKLVAILEIEGAIGSEMSKFTKICKFQKKLCAN